MGLAGGCAGAAVGVIVQRESRQIGCAVEIIVSGVLAVGEQGAAALTAAVAAASGPGDVIDLVVVNTIPDVLRIGKTEGVVVDIVFAKVNGDIKGTDTCDRMTVDQIADLDLDACRGMLVGRMQHHGAVGRICIYAVIRTGILRERSRRQKGADHHHGQQQAENSAQTGVVHNEILSFHCPIRAKGTDHLYGNASITFLVEL